MREYLSISLLKVEETYDVAQKVGEPEPYVVGMNIGAYAL